VKFPIGKLNVSDQVTLKDINGSLEKIKDYTVRLRDTVDGLSDVELNKTYRDDSLNVRELVHHIADSQLNLYLRLMLALTDDNLFVPSLEQDRWAVLPDTNLPVESSIKMLEGINERIITLGESLTENQLSRIFTLENDGVISVGTKMIKLSWHEEHHLAHIKIALTK